MSLVKYLSLKNLASIEEGASNWASSLELYLKVCAYFARFHRTCGLRRDSVQAAQIDSSDVTLWYHVGLVAMNVPTLGLARKAFEWGLRSNPKHVLCLDKLCEVRFALGDHLGALDLVEHLLRIDSSNVKVFGVDIT